MIHTRMWKFVADMNHDGWVTISDVWLWFTWLFFYPGDGFLYILMARFPGFSLFFEISGADYAGFLSGVISFFAWLCVLGLFYEGNSKYQEWFLQRDRNQ